LALLEFQTAGNDTGPAWRSPRWVSAALVVLIHLLVLLAVLHAPSHRAAVVQTKETIIRFFKTLRAAEPPVPQRPVNAPHRERARTLPPENVPLQLPQNIPALPFDTMEGLHQSLFGCAPENLAMLSAEARAHCDGAFIAAMRHPAPGFVKERAVDAARWAAGIKARNTPVRVPCVNAANLPSGAPASGGAMGTSIGLMVDPICVAKQLIVHTPK
jgi:hypothetical protein